MMKKQKEDKPKEAPKAEKTKIEKTPISMKFKSPIFLIIICAVLLTGAALGFSNVSKDNSGKINAINPEYVDLTSGSDAWNCPYLTSGADETYNSIAILNPGTRTSEISLKLYDINGKEIASKDYSLKPGESKRESISSFGKNINASAVVQSFGSPIVVYRLLALSDGKELLPCVRNSQDIIELDNLVTKRNTNTTLMLSNPHNEAVVADVRGRLFDSDKAPFQVQLDDLKGVVIPAFGRIDVDLQAAFGRHAMINVTVDTRSGFISGEALVDYKEGGDVQGQTIVTSSYSNLIENNSYLFGYAPLNIFAQSNTLNTASIDLESIGTGNRTLNAESTSVAIGSATSLSDPGVDYGFHGVKIDTNIGSSKNVSSGNSSDVELSYSGRPFVSVVSSFLSKGIVSSNTALSLKSKDIILPALDDDFIGILNPSAKDCKVTISFLGTNIAAKQFNLLANSFESFSLNDYELSGLTFLKIEATQNVVASASRIDFSGITRGVYLKK